MAMASVSFLIFFLTAAGFYYRPWSNTYLFGVYTVTHDGEYADMTSWRAEPVVVVWSANRDQLVQQNSTLSFTADGDLVLRNPDGGLVWSTNTSGQSVAGMTLTESGNLVLFNNNNLPVWQSFDHPTDSLLPGQRLVQGMRLTPSTSAENLTASSLYYLTVYSDGLYAFAGSSNSQPYYEFTVTTGNKSQNYPAYLTLTNRSLDIFVPSSSSANLEHLSLRSPAVSLQYIRFESDGQLRLYEWQANQIKSRWLYVQDIFPFQYCDYPTACGEYGICSNGLCSCPIATASNIQYFRSIDDRRPHLGCTLETPISCQSLQDHQLISLPNVSYLYYNSSPVSELSDEESCKQACLTTCSCKAALFRYFDDKSAGACTLVSQVLSLKTYHPGYDSLAFLKVQITPASHLAKHRLITLVLVLVGVASFFIMLTIVLAIVWIRRQQGNDAEDEFAQLPGMPTRFTFEVLKLATKDFSNKLGEGGFGSVFSGQLGEERIAVKCLDQASQGKREFFAEVETIGRIHHINLVRGLAYLHEECTQRIAHLDIKPQNILLDDNFNARISDFGLSKLIDRGQSHVTTRMRGTPGYLAPEWLTSHITEKVDVYSYGVVVIEIINGRPNLDHSNLGGGVQLVKLLQEKAENSHLEDMIDRKCNDMTLHQQEVIRIMKLAMWCLQNDCNRRPSMSLVMKVLEGERDVEANLNHNFFD
uniref:Receptor-like serine/threonine-protein kinase n=1 Tax=Leersia perrieri TaxID=77586 RepID=A0A0D9UY17_9ORYZ